MIEFKNESGLEFTDISSEEARVYEFESGRSVTIHAPHWLHVSTNGHRIFDASGTSHYIPNGWVWLHWTTRVGRAHFVK